MKVETRTLELVEGATLLLRVRGVDGQQRWQHAIAVGAGGAVTITSHPGFSAGKDVTREEHIRHAVAAYRRQGMNEKADELARLLPQDQSVLM